jgi:hypothetical protein
MVFLARHIQCKGVQNMKINRFVTLSVLALLVVGAMGFIKVGNQDEADTCSEVDESAEAPGSETEDAAGADTETDQTVLQAQAQVTVDQAQQAALAANPGATILKTDLDDENGALVYSVEFTGSIEVKVDAMTGTVLGTENGED